MRRYAAVLLDVDGTLVDSNHAHAATWAEVLDRPIEQVRRMIGMGGDRLIATLTDLDPHSHKAKKLTKHRAELFTKEWLPKLRPMLGTRELILRLRADHYLFGIASAAEPEILVRLLEVANIDDLVDLEHVARDVEHSKPDPETIEAALATLPVERSRTVMIGDTPYDVEAARAARVDVIGFTSGGWSAEALAGAVAVFEGPADLVARWGTSPLADQVRVSGCSDIAS